MSIFDPCCTISSWDLNWAISLAVILVSPSQFFMFISPTGVAVKLSFINLVIILSSKSGGALMGITLFYIIISMNFLGLVPFVFSVTSHFFFNFFISLPLWLCGMVWGGVVNFRHLLAHLTPHGCPMVLVPFMVTVELVSSVIQPITLALRMMANVLAGHLILHLIGHGIIYFFFPMSTVMFVLQTGFLTFELGVAMVQTFVFVKLLFMYWVEKE
uniref:ATP synthase F0 subunit 6 n=1 Tax=Austromenopon paululum TaxID=2965261 RepID=UPI0026E25727|nr:ATP synthase F0 subunit 6 [Austromenopon paululum]WJJ69867.1 ATP synthase subunit 6 [Austromenopon paululum]